MLIILVFFIGVSRSQPLSHARIRSVISLNCRFKLWFWSFEDSFVCLYAFCFFLTRTKCIGGHPIATGMGLFCVNYLIILVFILFSTSVFTSIFFFFFCGIVKCFNNCQKHHKIWSRLENIMEKCVYGMERREKKRSRQIGRAAIFSIVCWLLLMVIYRETRRVTSFALACSACSWHVSSIHAVRVSIYSKMNANHNFTTGLKIQNFYQWLLLLRLLLVSYCMAPSSTVAVIACIERAHTQAYA